MPFMAPYRRSTIVSDAFKAMEAANKKDAPKASKPAAKPEVARPKDDIVRSEKYLRLVASMPCKNCLRHGHSQAAHLPPDAKGKKVSDLETFALCADGPRAGQRGCHPQFDQYKLGDRAWTVRQGKRWAAETRREISDAGEWPKGLRGEPEEKARPKKKPAK